MTLGFFYRSELTRRQLNIMEGRVRDADLTGAEYLWFTENCNAVLIDNTRLPKTRGEREFCPPTFVAMSAKDD